jgi:hypothetical protein
MAMAGPNRHGHCPIDPGVCRRVPWWREGLDQELHRHVCEASRQPGRRQKRLTEKNFRITITEYHLTTVGALAMRRSIYVKILSCMMVVIFPAALFAAEPSPAAMLYAHGTTMLNGSTVPRSSALFSGDLVQTNADSVANINATGSTVLILNNSLVQYEGNAVKLEHGGVTVSTSKLLATRVGGVTVTPTAGVWTEFEVRDVDGRVQIVARKSALTITDTTGTTTLAEGQQTTRDESEPQQSRERQRREGGAAAAAVKGPFDSPIAVGVGLGAVVGLGAWALAQGDNPASPAR